MYNVAIGHSAGTVSTGSYNVFIGTNSGYVDIPKMKRLERKRKIEKIYKNEIEQTIEKTDN